MATVSVIVPNYNHARFLRQRIDSILAQTYQDFELILLDDCSADDSRSILRAYASHPRVRHVEFSETNSGSTFKQWNRGVRLTRGEYVWIAESDDYADPRFLESMVRALENDPSVTFAYCRSWRVLADGRLGDFPDGHLVRRDRRWAEGFCVTGREMCERYFCWTNAVPNASAVVFRKDAYERVGGAVETLRLCSDWRLWAALALEGRVAYSAEPLNFFRFHSASLRTRKQSVGLDVPEYLMVCKWVLSRCPLPEKKLREVLTDKAKLWVPAMLSSGVRRDTKRQIMRHVKVIDPHPLRSALRSYWTRAIEMAANAVYYPVLNVSYRARHATGLTREGLGRLRMRIVNR